MDFGDITPTGLTEKFTFEISPKLNIAVNLGQYIFYDNPESGYAVTPTRVATTNAAGAVTGFTTVNVYSTNPASTIPGASQERREDAILTYNDIVITYKPTESDHAHLAPGSTITCSTVRWASAATRSARAADARPPTP